MTACPKNGEGAAAGEGGGPPDGDPGTVAAGATGVVCDIVMVFVSLHLTSIREIHLILCAQPDDHIVGGSIIFTILSISSIPSV